MSVAVNLKKRYQKWKIFVRSVHISYMAIQIAIMFSATEGVPDVAGMVQEVII